MATEFDDAQFVETTQGDVTFERTVVRQYLEATAKGLGRLRTTISEGDALTSERLAHRIKGGSATLGATGFARIALAAEDAAHTGDLALAWRMLGELESEFLELKQYLERRGARAA